MVATEPTHSTSSGETESESESESEPEPVKTSKPAPTEESDLEKEQEPTTKPISSTPKTTMPISSSSEESDSESETEPEAVEKPKLDESESEPNVKPLSSTTPKPNETTKPLPISFSEEETENSDSESEPEKLPDQSKATGKRPMADLEGGHSKRAKMGIVIALAAPASLTGGGEKKQLFQRLYSEENEIELIQGMISFVEQKGKDPLSHAGQFYDFVKGSLNVDVTYKQLLSKIRKLKLKFRNNAVKIDNNGKVKSLNNSHEKKMYELSEKVWGNGSKNDVRSSKKVKTVSSGNGSEEVKPKLVSRNESNIPDEITRCVGFEKLSEADKIEMEKKWKDIKLQELVLYIKKVDLMKEQAELVLNATIKSGNGAK